jgi:hypothetical protein
VQEWIENFNIGSIMHMVPLIYEEFSSYGEMIYEISKRVLLEKVGKYAFIEDNLSIDFLLHHCNGIPVR